MRKKSILGILFIFSISFSTVIISVRGETYTNAFEAGDQVILETVELGSFYANLHNVNLGDKFKFIVTNVTEGADSFSIEIDEWGIISGNETFGTIPDYQWTLVLPKDPTTFFFITYYVVLSPVSTYLHEYALGDSDVTSNGNTIQIYDSGSVDTVEMTFDSNGIISELKQSNSTDLFYLMKRKSSTASISGPDLPILIGITTMTVLSLVYIWRKRKLI